MKMPKKEDKIMENIFYILKEFENDLLSKKKGKKYVKNVQLN